MAGIVVASIQLPFAKDPLAQLRADAGAALESLGSGDLTALDERLAANRGDADFAYLFTSKVSPRALGDALATAASPSNETPLKADVEAHGYELVLTDLAGTLALATYGTRDRALPGSWTDDFISATTHPESLYGEADDSPDASAEERAGQDVANKQNLLLILSRGYWSTGFLEAATAAYVEFDRDQGDDAWPGATLDDAMYAPAPSGGYLTDGILALVAALTTNPAASVWAFRDFLPGTDQIDGSDYVVGKFTHYLLFEHDFPESADGGAIGMTATLTALSSAIDATGGSARPQTLQSFLETELGNGPMHDSLMLQALAKKVTGESGCSWDPRDYWSCAKDVAEAVWHWTKRWGHVALDVLSLATFAPPPFTAIGIAAALTNATWYAIDGDYANAGLSLAAAVPGLAFGKIVKAVKAGASAEKAAAGSDDIAKAAAEARVGAKAATTRELAEAGASRVAKSPYPSSSSEKEVERLVATEIKGSVTQKILNPPGCEILCLGRRFVDVWVPKSNTAIELKVGTKNEAHALAEIEKDLALLRDPSSEVKAVQWRFYPDAKGSVGPTTKVLQKLQEHGIPYTMYVP